MPSLPDDLPHDLRLCTYRVHCHRTIPDIQYFQQFWDHLDLAVFILQWELGDHQPGCCIDRIHDHRSPEIFYFFHGCPQGFPVYHQMDAPCLYDLPDPCNKLEGKQFLVNP